ncbi:MAG: hypothetical protein AABY18_08170 [Candidatus Thermoplasmatota archaeon]
MVVLERGAGNLWVSRFTAHGALRTLAAMHAIAAGSCALVVVLGGAVLATGTSAPDILAIVMAAFLALATVSGLAFLGLRRNRPWQRMASIAASTLVTAVFPLGTLAGIYGILLLPRAIRDHPEATP